MASKLPSQQPIRSFSVSQKPLNPQSEVIFRSASLQPKSAPPATRSASAAELSYPISDASEKTMLGSSDTPQEEDGQSLSPDLGDHGSNDILKYSTSSSTILSTTTTAISGPVNSNSHLYTSCGVLLAHSRTHSSPARLVDSSDLDHSLSVRPIDALPMKHDLEAIVLPTDKIGTPQHHSETASECPDVVRGRESRSGIPKLSPGYLRGFSPDPNVLTEKTIYIVENKISHSVPEVQRRSQGIPMPSTTKPPTPHEAANAPFHRRHTATIVDDSTSFPLQMPRSQVPKSEIPQLPRATSTFSAVNVNRFTSPRVAPTPKVKFQVSEPARSQSKRLNLRGIFSQRRKETLATDLPPVHHQQEPVGQRGTTAATITHLTGSLPSSSPPDVVANTGSLASAIVNLAMEERHNPRKSARLLVLAQVMVDALAQARAADAAMQAALQAASEAQLSCDRTMSSVRKMGELVRQEVAALDISSSGTGRGRPADKRAIPLFVPEEHFPWM